MNVWLVRRMYRVLRIRRWLRVRTQMVDEWKGLRLLCIKLVLVVLDGTRLRGIRHGD